MGLTISALLKKSLIKVDEQRYKELCLFLSEK